MGKSNFVFAALLGLIAFISYALIAYIPGAHSDPANYERSVLNVLVHEGGAHYTDHPADPGGPTKYGITIWDVRRFLNPKATANDVKALTEKQALDIYRSHYANPIQFDRLPPGVDYSVFDYSINAGIGRAVGDFSRVLRVPYSQRMTNEMVAAAKILDPVKVADQLNDRRMAFQMGLGARYAPFKRGWANRIRSVKTIAHQMAGGQARGSLDEAMFSIPRIGAGKAYDVYREEGL